jgi:prepilin-type N-terminal cleavage/methylation domain-containing protein
MSARRDGFTLVELMVVTLLLALVLGAVYRTLTVQEETYRAGGAVIQGQETLRTALGILESELREVSTTGSDIGGPDIRAADPDSVVFRAARKVSFICDISRNEKWIVTASEGDPIARGDSLLIFVDGDSLRWQDDAWDPSLASDVATTSSSACAARFPGLAVQTVKLPVAQDLSGVRLYSPVRTFDWVTYTLQRYARPLDWSLVRRTPKDGKTVFLLGGLAPPGEGLRFEYFDELGNPTSVGSEVARMRIGVTVAERARAHMPAQSLTTNLYLRNN